MVWLLFLLLRGPEAACGPEAWQSVERARTQRERAGAAEAAAELVRGVRESPQCVPLGVAGWATSGWLAARAAAPKGGATEALTSVKDALGVLETLTARPTWRVQNEYARAAVTAAVAAAQDERPEMSVYLTHARGLSDRLALAGERAEWPLPIDELEGELWLEVDRYAEARDAYERAVVRVPSPSALVGLARVYVRLDDEPGACNAYRRAQADAGGALAAEVRQYLERPVCRQ